MTKKLRILLGGFSILLITAVTFVFYNQNVSEKTLTLEQQRAKHAKIVEDSPFKETLTWDKRKRKKEGLPPNRYFEQMWELTVNPSTGNMEDGNLTLIREELIQRRSTQRNPGEAGNAWEERGPNDIGGRTRAMLFDPNDNTNNTLYAGGVSGGLWRNTNITSASSQWERVQNVPGNLSVTSITVDPNNSNRWFVGTGEQYTAGDVVGNGVYVTNDGGNSWSAINIPAAGGATFEFNASNLFLSGLFYVNDVLAWDNNGNTELFVGVGAAVYGDSGNPRNFLGLQTAGLYHSTNAGTTWNRIEGTALEANISGADTFYAIPNDLEVSANNTLWMGTISNAFGSGGGRVLSSTNGTTWTEAGASPLTDSNRVEIALSSSNPNKMYALTQGAGAAPVHVYTTTNAFATISSGALPNDADTGIAANDFTRGQSFYDLMIEVDPSNDNILYVGGIDLFRSTNSASGWTQISKWSNNPGLSALSAPLVHADQHAMTFRPGNSNQAVFGNDGGIFYASSLSAASGNGSAISVRNNNYNVTQYVKAGIGPNGNGDALGIFTAGAQDNGSQAFRNANAAPGINGSEELSDGDGFYTFVDKDGQYMIATFVNNVIYRFNLPWNGLGRRQGGATTLSSDQSRGDFVNPMDYDSDANRLLTNNSNQTENAIKSINVASNSNGSITNAALTASPTAFRASPFANNTWYVGLADGGLVRMTNVTNSSATFTTITTPFVGSVSSVRYGETANDIFVTIHNYGVASVWATSNGGSSWQNKEGNLPNLPVRDMLQNPLNRDEAILATQLGVWSTSNFNDANPTWEQAFNGMSDASVTSFDYWAVNGNDTDNKIIASTYGRGVFTGTFTGSTNSVDNENPTAPTSLLGLNITEVSINLSWTASTDNVGVDSYDVLQNGVVIGNTATTSFAVTGLTASTQYSFTVIAKDAAGNVSNESNTLNVSTISVSTGCSNSISSFPYSEGFENGIGAWTQSSSDNIDWTVNSGTTPSGNTGPTTATEGSSYIYVEASGEGDGFPNRRAILTSPCFDLSALSAANFSFQYHMFGSDDSGDVDLEVSTNGGANWTSIWNQTGNQGDQWLSVDIDLAPYLGGEIQLRFNRITGGTWQSDVAIDDVNVTSGGNSTPTLCNDTVSNYPYTQNFESGIGTWAQSNSDDIDWTVNSGTTPSGNTGPTSATEGSNYIYVEASGEGDGFPNRRAILTSPCFDLSALSDANFSFQYHMFGSEDSGDVDLEVSTNGGANWTSIWNQTGNQGDQWLTVDIDLAAYIGTTIQLRFNRITGGTWQSDVAIDDISLSQGDASAEECDALNFNDFALNSFSTQDNDGANSIGNSGASLTLSNNTWKYIDFPYTVTENTVIELEFSSTSEGEIHGIGFDNDNTLSDTFYFKFYGTQDYGITNFDNYTNGTVTYIIPVGDSYTGTMDRLVFINDNDASSGNNSTFTNVKIYETSCSLSATTTQVAFGERVDVLGNEGEVSLKMYPNPVKNILNVEVIGVENASYRIINMLGQTVLRGSYTEKIEVGTLNDGVYFLELNTGKQSISKKFIKQ